VRFLVVIVLIILSFIYWTPPIAKFELSPIRREFMRYKVNGELIEVGRDCIIIREGTATHNAAGGVTFRDWSFDCTSSNHRRQGG